MNLRWLIGLTLVAGTVAAQHGDPVGMLASGDAELVEVARRRLVVGPADAVPQPVIERLLGARDGFRRQAAASVLAAHGLRGAAFDEWSRIESEPAVLLPLVGALDDARLTELASADLAGGDEASRDSLRAAAFGELVARDLADPECWSTALGATAPELRSLAARLLVAERWPWPIELVADIERPDAVLDQLVHRPRADAADWLRGLRATDGTAPFDRVLALVALPSASWSATDARELLDASLGEDPIARSVALEGLDRLSPTAADRLVADAHRRALEGAELDAVLDGLRRISPNGERHLIGLARVLPEAARESIVEWLAERGSDALEPIVIEALDGRYPLTAELLRRAGPVLDDPVRLATARRALVDGDTETMRTAAFVALAASGIEGDALLDHVFADPESLRRRARIVIEMPVTALSIEGWRRLVAVDDDRTRRAALARLADAPDFDAGVVVLREVAAIPGPEADFAADLLLRRGSVAIAQSVWQSLDGDRRRMLAIAVADRDEDWVLDALRAEPLQGEPSADARLALARLSRGDHQIVELVLSDLTAWPVVWLRRMPATVPGLLIAGDAPRLLATCADRDLDPMRRRLAVRWLAGRVDLGGDELLLAIYRGETDFELRLDALRGVLRRPAIAAPIVAEVDGALAAGLDGDLLELAYERIGSFARPLDETAMRFVARLILVEPLAHGLESAGDGARLAMVRDVFQREPGLGDGAAFQAAVAEAAAHPDAALASEERYGRLLGLLARDPRTRQTMAPALARLLLAVPSLDASYHGVAWATLAEQHETAAEFEAAALAWDRAGTALLRNPAPPLVQRAVVGDHHVASGLVPGAAVAGRAALCRARAALAAGDSAGVRQALAEADERGGIDVATAEEIEELNETVRKLQDR